MMMMRLSGVIGEISKRLISKESGEQIGVKSGFWQLDKMLDGLCNGDLILLASRPGMGKTTLATQVALNVAEQDESVLYFCLGQSAYLCAKRLIEIHMKRCLKNIKTNELEWLEATGILSRLPLCIDDSSISCDKICQRARSRNKKWGLIIIDGSGQFNDNIEKAVRIFKRLAKELDVPVILTVNLTREPEKRQDHQPRLTDIKNFTAFSRWADTVLLLYREAYYNICGNPGTAVIIVAKNHYGEIGSVELLWENRIFHNWQIKK